MLKAWRSASSRLTESPRTEGLLAYVAADALALESMAAEGRLVALGFSLRCSIFVTVLRWMNDTLDQRTARLSISICTWHVVQGNTLSIFTSAVLPVRRGMIWVGVALKGASLKSLAIERNLYTENANHGVKRASSR